MMDDFDSRLPYKTDGVGLTRDSPELCLLWEKINKITETIKNYNQSWDWPNIQIFAQRVKFCNNFFFTQGASKNPMIAW